MKKFAALAILVSVAALAQTPTAPKLTDAQKLKFFKAQAEFQAAQMQAEHANQTAQAKQGALQAAVKELETVCGKDFQPSINAQGDLECAAKPVEKAK